MKKTNILTALIIFVVAAAFTYTTSCNSPMDAYPVAGDSISVVRDTNTARVDSVVTTKDTTFTQK